MVPEVRQTGSRAAAAPWSLLLICLLPALALPAAADSTALPQPLTLQHALAAADEPHPALDAARAAVDLARADLAHARSLRGTRAFIDLTPQGVQPANGASGFIDDSRARLVLSKPLYDFGRSQARERAADLAVAAREQAWLDQRAHRRLEVMARFFDVLLADLRFAVDNETMARNYVAFDQGRERHEVGRLSDIELLELESRFEDARARRTESQARQSSARHQLALALNRPHDIPRDVAAPALADLDRDVPDYAETLEAVLARNPRAAALRADLEAARAAIAAERARRRPVVSAEAEAAYYERPLPSREEARATLNLRIPLYQGGEDQAAIARANANMDAHAARLAEAELTLRQTLWDLLQEIETLRAERQAARVRVRHRDLYLDRSRALYELEVRTDLGDAMIRNTEAAWLAAQADYRLALAWARLSALAGHLPMTEERAP